MTCLANAIELRNITKRFGQVVANKSISLELHKGEILSLLGENGSGKTTLMNMLSGIYYPDEGQIFVDGKEVEIRSPKDAFDLHIGMIHQHFKLVDVFTAAENIILGLPGDKGKMDKNAVAKAVREIADRYGFEVVGTVAVKPGVPPTPGHLEDLVARGRADGVDLVVHDVAFQDSLVRSVAERVGAPMATISVMAGGLPGTRSYADFVEANLRAMVDALGAAPDGA